MTVEHVSSQQYSFSVLRKSGLSIESSFICFLPFTPEESMLKRKGKEDQNSKVK
jgi:hypothetical protein